MKILLLLAAALAALKAQALAAHQEMQAVVAGQEIEAVGKAWAVWA